jgi:hypothetical protein
MMFVRFWEKVGLMKMRVLVATTNQFWVCRGLLTTYEKPTMNSEYEFIVATPGIFISGGELEKVMGHFNEYVL